MSFINLNQDPIGFFVLGSHLTGNWPPKFTAIANIEGDNASTNIADTEGCIGVTIEDVSVVTGQRAVVLGTVRNCLGLAVSGWDPALMEPIFHNDIGQLCRAADVDPAVVNNISLVGYALPKNSNGTYDMWVQPHRFPFPRWPVVAGVATMVLP